MEKLINNYLFKALDAYPFYLEEAVESLNYALSYDEKNTTALGLIGQINAEVLKDYEKAKTYFSEALAINIHAIGIYPKYINVLLWNEDYEEAARLIDFALTVKGSDKAVLYLKKAILNEQLKAYKKALSFLKLAKEHTYNSEYLEDINSDKARIKEKMLKNKPRKSKKKKKVKK
jgi:tetratricopeptide (TPR) repeat protein